MTHYYLLDNNVYTVLRKRPNAVRDFNISIRDVGIIPVNNVKHILTPYSVMEAVGIEIEDPKIILPKKLKLKGDINEVFSYVLKEAKAFYNSRVNRDEFLAKASVQSSFTVNEIRAKDLEKICVQKPLSSVNFENYFSQYLAFDFAFKYNFPRRLEFDLNEMFHVNAFFTDNSFIARLSKFRVTKKFWDKIYPELLKSNQHQSEVVEAINSSMRLKTFKDFLDCDIIHLATVGNHDGDTFNPTIAFTMDDPQTIINRVMAYKTHIEYLKSNLDESLKQIFRKPINEWQEGIICFCDDTGVIRDFIEIKNVKAFF